MLQAANNYAGGSVCVGLQGQWAVSDRNNQIAIMLDTLNAWDL